MHTVRAEFTVALGKAAEFEGAVARWGEVGRGQLGFQGLALWNSVGYPTQYAVLTRWESREAMNAFHHTAAFSSAVDSLTNLVAVPRPPEVYEVVLDAGQAGGQFLSLIDWKLPGGTAIAAAFENRSKQMFDVHEKYVPGWVGSRLRRSLAVPNRYLVMRYGQTIASVHGAEDPPEVHEFRRANPPGDYAGSPLSVGFYEPVFSAPGH
jgi:heme-degrading monooxygenase HmoA